MKILTLILTLAVLTGCHGRNIKSSFDTSGYDCPHYTRDGVCLYWIEKGMLAPVELIADRSSGTLVLSPR